METPKRSLYLYPITKHTFRAGGNTYMLQLQEALSQYYSLVNTPTSLGLLDVLLKLHKTDVIYLNWIEDIAGKRFAVLQALLLGIILVLSRLFQIKVIWFVHNNLSHYHHKLWLKKIIVQLLAKHASLVLSHSSAVSYKIPKGKFFVFDHPIEAYKPLPVTKSTSYDLLIWGSMTPHKGIEEFLKFNYASQSLLEYKIMLAGKCCSQAYYESLQQYRLPNIFMDNRILSEEELKEYHRTSTYVLFTYNAPSVLSSGALCKSLSYGKPIIGPQRGSFKELGQKGLIYNYKSFLSLRSLLEELNAKETLVNHARVKDYAATTSWAHFAAFVHDTICGYAPQKLSLAAR